MDIERHQRSSSESPNQAGSKGQSRLLGWLPRAAGLLLLGLLWLSVPAPAEAQPVCAHDICESGDALASNCDSCVQDICRFDPYCCDGAQGGWDDFCIEKVLTECGDWICAAACKHNLCEVGEPLDSTCNTCAAQVCFEDPICCTDTWDSTCIGLVGTVCNHQCTPGANSCADATPVFTGGAFGTLTDSTNDGSESGNDSGRSGDVWYTYTHVVDQQFNISTCKTERSFGIDTVLSVHEGCPGTKNNEIRANDDWKLGLAPTACFDADPTRFLDSAIPVGGGFGLDIGQTVLIRVAHHDDSVRGNFELRLLPEPEVWMALVAGAGSLAALSRRRARR
ncbi:MAG: hypothetical protein JRE57_11365 [Deltaproteobacteria bacterium]|nr:hypothetical protein [Deltaproteobacteria bacterium]